MRWVAPLLLALVSAAALPGAASLAQDRPLDAPRAAGLVAERYDGYAVVRESGAPADVQALVDQVNAERRALYQERAAVEGAPVEEVGKVYARQIMTAAPAGTWFLGEDGNWVQK